MPAYLDNAATTPMRPEAVEALLPVLTDRFGNPSGSHAVSREARKAVDEARDTAWEPDGFPKRSVRKGSIASTACGRMGVVAALSRYAGTRQGYDHAGPYQQLTSQTTLSDGRSIVRE